MKLEEQLIQITKLFIYTQVCILNLSLDNFNFYQSRLNIWLCKSQEVS